ncbi:hypothetical protein [Rhodococcus daqingensis]|uniref:Uncharacterized protein n=1 Tax=Rhodococcus daqingensis TaxID=2479363 RepID=A0ABW2S4U4_9NOCA
MAILGAVAFVVATFVGLGGDDSEPTIVPPPATSQIEPNGSDGPPPSAQAPVVGVFTPDPYPGQSAEEFDHLRDASESLNALIARAKQTGDLDTLASANQIASELQAAQVYRLGNTSGSSKPDAAATTTAVAGLCTSVVGALTAVFALRKAKYELHGERLEASSAEACGRETAPPEDSGTTSRPV